MKTIITTILTCVGKSLGQILLKFLSVAKEALVYLNYTKAEKKKEKKEQEIKRHNDKVKEACDNGSVEDLLNL